MVQLSSGVRNVVPMNALGRATTDQRPEIDAAIRRVLDGGWYVHGPEHAAFEAEFAAFLGARHAIGVASGTDALEIALRSSTTGGTAVVAANAGGYASVAARRGGFSVRFADVDPRTLCMSPATVEEALRGGEPADAVIVTHLYGRIAPVAEIVDICRAYGAVVVEDCAQSTGARIEGGRAVGTFGDVAAFSFYPTKNLGALGDAGCVVSSDTDIAGRAKQLRQYGWREKYTSELRGGANSRLDELQAAILRVRLPLLDAHNRRRRDIIGHYTNAAGGGPLQLLPVPTTPEHTGHLCVGLAADRDAVRSQLAAAGVSTDVHYPVPDHQQPAFAAEYASVRLPVTERAAQQVVSIPCFPELTEAEVGQVTEALARLC